MSTAQALMVAMAIWFATGLFTLGLARLAERRLDELDRRIQELLEAVKNIDEE